ncbi:MAG: choice-of-anchor Q domain-containing protein [Dehalococcoidia bacterium]
MPIHLRIMTVSAGILAVAVLTAFAGLRLATPAHAADIAVNTTDDENNVDGDCSLREAVEAANTDAAVDACTAGAGADTIAVPAGTYLLETGELEITTDVTINGAGAADTIVDNADDTGRVFNVNESAATVVINDLTVQNGQSGDGGGIWTSGTLTINNVVVQDSFADGDGGGIFISGSGTLNATNCQVINNEAADEGGGIMNEGPDTLNLNGCLVSGNHASDDGGGIANVFDATGTIDGSTISGNTADSDGGGIYIDQCCGVEPFVITNSTISGNTSTGDDGGGVNVEDGEATVTNVTISGNSAADTGGGFRVDDGASAALTNVTITGNSAAPDGGGGVAAMDEGAATLLNTIVAENPDGDDCAILGTLTSSGHNLSSDDSCGFTGTGDQINTDPLLEALALNAPGSTQTHALTADSPAVDTGDDAGCPATDQRGVTRPQDGDDDGTAVCDVGAYELEGAAPTPTAVPIAATPTAAPAELPDTGGTPASDSSVPWLGLLAAIGAAAVTGGALAATRRR